MDSSGRIYIHILRLARLPPGSSRNHCITGLCGIVGVQPLDRTRKAGFEWRSACVTVRFRLGAQLGCAGVTMSPRTGHSQSDDLRLSLTWLVNPVAVGTLPIPVMAVLVVGVRLAGVAATMRGRMVPSAIVRATCGRGTCGVVMRAARSWRVGTVGCSERCGLDRQKTQQSGH